MTSVASVPRLRRAGTVVLTALVAGVVNLLVHAGGSVAGGTYEFTSDAGPARVDILTLMGFTTVPLLVGLAVAAALSRRLPWVIGVAHVVAPVLAIGSIPVMPMAVDLDAPSTVALAAAHVVVGAAAVLGLLRPRRLAEPRG